MRQRHIFHLEGREPAPNAAFFSQRISKVDLFPKVKEDYQREQTKCGAVVSLATVIIICFLVFWEGIAYVRGRDAYDTDVTIDSGASDDMQVHLDVFFPNMQCHRLSIDVIDATGAQIYNYSGSVYKVPTGVDGSPLYKGSKRDLVLAVEIREGNEEFACRKCPETIFRHLPDNVRISSQSRCCNSCGSVQAVFAEAGEAPPGIDYIPQCLEELSVQGRGCSVVGSLSLKKVPVTVILGPRRTGVGYSFKDVLGLDTSHHIRKLRIGDESVERFSENGVSEPLTGHVSKARTYLETRYVVNVVRTTYRTRKSPEPKAPTYEYSAQWHSRVIAPGMLGKVPAMIIRFEPSALQVNNFFKRPPIPHFLVQMCGIVGGTFVVLGFVDRMVEWWVSRLKT